MHGLDISPHIDGLEAQARGAVHLLPPGLGDGQTEAWTDRCEGFIDDVVGGDEDPTGSEPHKGLAAEARASTPTKSSPATL